MCVIINNHMDISLLFLSNLKILSLKILSYSVAYVLDAIQNKPKVNINNLQLLDSHSKLCTIRVANITSLRITHM